MQRLLLSAMVRKHLGRSPLLVHDKVQRDLRIGIPFKFYVLLFCLIVFFFWLVSLWTLLQLRA